MDTQQMTSDEHCKLLGKLMGMLQSLEFILRAFLQELPSARAIGIPYGTDLYSFPVGTELPESEIASYDTLRDLINRFNDVMNKQGGSTIDVKLVDMRDALAHGRVSGPSPNATLRLLKFGRPDKKGRVRVVFNQEMNKAWFKAQITRVHQAVLAVYKVMPEQGGEPTA